jgi:hypothetical protein
MTPGQQCAVEMYARGDTRPCHDSVWACLEELTRLRSSHAEEFAIVDRCWKALGIETYEQARGLSIDQIIRDLKSSHADLLGACESILYAVSDDRDETEPFAWHVAHAADLAREAINRATALEPTEKRDGSL